MSFAVVGYCQRCGAPIYTEAYWWGKVPPPSYYSCECWIREGTPFYKITTQQGTRPPEKQKEERK